MQKAMVEIAIKTKQAFINALEDNMAREIFRNERDKKFPPVEPVKPLPVGAIDILGDWEMERARLQEPRPQG